VFTVPELIALGSFQLATAKARFFSGIVTLRPSRDVLARKDSKSSS
jgi:hypothetical protein